MYKVRHPHSLPVNLLYTFKYLSPIPWTCFYVVNACQFIIYDSQCLKKLSDNKILLYILNDSWNRRIGDILKYKIIKLCYI